MTSTMDTQRDVKKMGYLKRQKTLKKKLFVLREESLSGPARMEYYDNEKKFVCNNPKRSIHLHNCFSINAKSDAKHKYVIVLFTKEDCFGIICETEDDQREWLSAMVELRNYHSHGASASPMYEHIWPVTVKSKGLGSGKHLVPGQYRLCLTPKELSFIRPNYDSPDLVFQLASIRKCGHTECFFYLEPGRMAVTGSGVLWMQVEDIVIAQNMHEAILSFMTASNMSADQPMIRPRRHTVSDKTKPANVPNKPRAVAAPSRSTATLPVARSKTIGAADQLSRRRMSPSKTSSNTLRPLTSIDLSMGPALSPPSPVEGARSRTDSMDSSASHNTGSFSADEMDSPLEECGAESSTPTGSPMDSYMPMEPNLRSIGLSPVASSPALSRQMADYMEVDQGMKSHEADQYLDMDVVRNKDTSRARTSPSIHRSRVASGRKTSISRLSESRSDDHEGYMDMALGSSREETIFGDEASIDSGVRLDCSRSVELRPASRTSSRGQSETDGYIPMNIGATALDENSYIDMSRGSSVAVSPTLSSTSSLHESLGEANYLSMSVRSNSLPEQDEYFEVGNEPRGYAAMSRLSGSPRPSLELRPDRVCSYLADENSDQLPLRSSSVGSRPQLVLQNKSLNESYMDMRGRKESSGTDERTSSAPILSRTLQARASAIRNANQSQSQRTLERSSKETLEEKDFLMEMEFQNRRSHGREHEYEEIRPRASSGGSHDFRPRTSSSGSQERRRTGSFGYREKLSKLASLARASVQEYRKLENGHRPRIATISQDTFHKRTSSFGAVGQDMRPRSSSHGNSRYVDMTGRLRKSSSQTCSQDSLSQVPSKRSSQESVASTASDYLDMRLRVSTSPSQALVAMFKSMDKSRRSPHSPLLTDSDYLSMEPGKSSGESSVECNSTELNLQRTGGMQSPRGRTRGKRSSMSSRPSHSSTESLASNTSQSSDGRGTERTRALSASTITEDNSGAVGGARPRRTSSKKSENELRVKATSSDDSYVLYSPGSSRDPSPNVSGSLDKVSSPIVGDVAASPGLLGASANPPIVKDKHEYVNVNYNKASSTQVEGQQVQPKEPIAQSLAMGSDVGSKQVHQHHPLPVPMPVYQHPMPVHQPPTGPSIPCPKVPETGASGGRSMQATGTASASTVAGSLRTVQPDSQQSNNRSKDNSEESDYLLISPGSEIIAPAAVKQERHNRLDLQEASHELPGPGQLPGPHQLPAPQQLPGPGQLPAPHQLPAPQVCEQTQVESDYMFVSSPSTDHSVGAVGGVPAESDYMDLTPGFNKDPINQSASTVRPRPKLPAMPVPLPKLQPVVSPIRDISEGVEIDDIKVTPLPVSEVDEYIEFGCPSQQNVISPHIDVIGIDPDADNDVPMATSSETLPGQQQRPLDVESLQLSSSKSSLSSSGSPEVNYATLDLQMEKPETTVRPKHASSESSTSSDSPDEGLLQYAQIDFQKSEELRKNSDCKKTRAPFDI